MSTAAPAKAAAAQIIKRLPYAAITQSALSLDLSFSAESALMPTHARAPLAASRNSAANTVHARDATQENLSVGAAASA